MKMPHTHAPRGKRIRVVLKSGEEFVDKFIERLPHEVIFAERIVATADIKSFTIYRERPVKTNPKSGKNRKRIKVTIKGNGKPQKLEAKNKQEVARIISEVIAKAGK